MRRRSSRMVLQLVWATCKDQTSRGRPPSGAIESLYKFKGRYEGEGACLDREATHTRAWRDEVELGHQTRLSSSATRRQLRLLIAVLLDRLRRPRARSRFHVAPILSSRATREPSARSFHRSSPRSRFHIFEPCDRKRATRPSLPSS